MKSYFQLHEDFQESEDIGYVNHISMKWYDAWYGFVTGKQQGLSS